MYIKQAVIDYGTKITVQADDTGMKLVVDDEHGYNLVFVGPDEMADLIEIAKLLKWECVDEL